MSLGREFIRQGLEQVGESHDEGETATAFAEVLAVVFQAVMRSSLSGPERLLFAIDAELADDYRRARRRDRRGPRRQHEPEDWSAVADTLAGRLKTGRPAASGMGTVSRGLPARPGHELDRHGAGGGRPGR